MAGYHDLKEKLGEDLARILGGFGFNTSSKIKAATDSELITITRIAQGQLERVRKYFPHAKHEG